MIELSIIKGGVTRHMYQPQRYICHFQSILYIICGRILYVLFCL